MANLEQYWAMLRVNKHRLDDELEIQPEIMDQISTQVVLRNNRMIEAKDDLARIEGRLADDVREDDPKAGVAFIDSRVRREPERIEAFRRYQQARAEHEAWQGLLEAWKQKGYSIKTLSDLYNANYFSLSSTQISARRRSQDEASDDARAALRRASHGLRQINPAEENPAPRRRALT